MAAERPFELNSKNMKALLTGNGIIQTGLGRKTFCLIMVHAPELQMYFSLGDGLIHLVEKGNIFFLSADIVDQGATF